MTAVFAARRRAEEFAATASTTPRPRRGPADRRELLDVVTALRATPPVRAATGVRRATCAPG